MRLGGTLLGEGDLLVQPGLVAALEVLAEEGAASVYRGSLAEALLDVPGIVIERNDLESYEACWREPIEVPYAGTAFFDTRWSLWCVATARADAPTRWRWVQPSACSHSSKRS